MIESVERRPGFQSPYPVAVSQTGITEWETTAPLVYHGSHQDFRIDRTDTDFGSVPAWLRGLIQFNEVASAVVHDWLWRHRVPASRDMPPEERVTYRDADGILRQALMTQNVGMIRRWIIWAGVRLGALTRPGGWHLWWRDAPAVIGICLPLVPIVLLPAPLGLALLNLAEWLVSPLDGRRHRLQSTPYPSSTEEAP